MATFQFSKKLKHQRAIIKVDEGKFVWTTVLNLACFFPWRAGQRVNDQTPCKSSLGNSPISSISNCFRSRRGKMIFCNFDNLPVNRLLRYEMYLKIDWIQGIREKISASFWNWNFSGTMILYLDFFRCNHIETHERGKKTLVTICKYLH